jgi:hypothetical protein
MENRTKQLATVLGYDKIVPLEATQAELHLKQKYEIGEHIVEVTAIDVPSNESSYLFKVKNVNKKNIALGRINRFENFEQARHHLLRDLVTNSLPMSIVTKSFEMRTDIVNGLCIIKKRVEDFDNHNVLKPEVVYFIIGSSVVSLSSADGDQDIKLLSKELERAFNNK